MFGPGQKFCSGLLCRKLSGKRILNMLECLKRTEKQKETDKMPTVKLYDANAYDTDFCAQVLSCEEKKAKKGKQYQVILDRTLFFPEEGGQSPDQGILFEENSAGQARTGHVLDVQLQRGGDGEEIIVHTLDIPFDPGETVQGKIDWQHRFSNMQQHTGEHIFSGIVHRRFGFRNVGFHLSDSIVTMDYDGMLSEEQAAEVEWEANRVIVSNLPVKILYPAPEEEKTMDYRSKKEVQGQLRIVEIPGCDVCACCAPHVRHTGEIGVLKVMQIQNYKGGVRLSILCGFRALSAFREKARIVKDLMHLFSSGQDRLTDHVARMKEREQELELQISRLKQNQLLEQLKQIPADEKNVFLFTDETDMLVLRQGVNFLTERHEGFCGIFSEQPGTDGESEKRGYRFIIGSAAEDCRKAAEALRQGLGAKGGGSREMIQGSVCAGAEEIKKSLTEISGV